MARPPISVLLPTYNCAAIVRDTLESIKWADEILVVDSYSTDGTLDICREYGARVIQHEYINSAKQKNWAAPQCSHEWVLQVDSDEALEAGLREEIKHAVASASANDQAFRIPRKITSWDAGCDIPGFTRTTRRGYSSGAVAAG